MSHDSDSDFYPEEFENTSTSSSMETDDAYEKELKNISKKVDECLLQLREMNLRSSNSFTKKAIISFVFSLLLSYFIYILTQ